MKIKYVIPVVILLISAILYSGYLLGSRKIDRALQATIDAQNDQIQKYITRIGDDSVFIAQKDTEILSQREAIKRGDIERKELRALNLKQVSEINRLNLRVDTLLEDISHTGHIIRIDTVFVDSMPHNAILLPFSFNKTDQWLSLKGSFNSIGKLDFSFKMNIDIDLWVGRLKGSKELTSIVTTANPYVNVIGIKSQKYDLPKPKPYGIGFSCGYAICRNGLSPYVGIGLNYSVIRF